MKTLLAATLAVATLAAPGLSRAATYELDPAHTSASFSVRHLMVTNVRGEFGKVVGTVEYDEKEPTKAKVEATIDVSSITTRDEKRDNHLKSPDFFDAAKYPNITFKSKKVEKSAKGLRVVGDFTIRGVTKEVVLDVEGPTKEIKDPWGNAKVGAAATTKINRQDYGVKWNKSLDGGGVVVGDEVAIHVDVEMLKKPAAEAKH
jgi:polyisoprenoid-binding protein YceI